MSAEQVFSSCGLLAMAGWVLLVVTPRRSWASTLVSGQVIPLLLSMVYLILLALHLHEAKGGFKTLADVHALFSNDWVLLAGWIHYLAFDLFTGSWQARDAAARGISRWPLIPCLVLTFLFGPVGLLCYFALRGVMGKATEPQKETDGKYAPQGSL